MPEIRLAWRRQTPSSPGDWIGQAGSLQEQIDTTSSGGKLIFQVLEALVAFERDLIRERTHAGLAAARARGRLFGRPRSLTTRRVEQLQTLAREEQNTVMEICETLRISRATYYRYVK